MLHSLWRNRCQQCCYSGFLDYQVYNVDSSCSLSLLVRPWDNIYMSALFHLLTCLRLGTLLGALCLCMSPQFRNVLHVGESTTIISVGAIGNTVLFSCSSSQMYLSATFPALVTAANEITLSAAVDMLRQLAAHVLSHSPPSSLILANLNLSKPLVNMDWSITNLWQILC